MRSNVDGNKCRALAKETYMWDLVRPAAVAVKDTARAIAPVKKATETGGQPIGDYKRRLFRRTGALSSGVRIWYVGSNARNAMWVEIGAHLHDGGRTHAHHTLVTACRTNRLRLSLIRE